MILNNGLNITETFAVVCGNVVSNIVYNYNNHNYKSITNITTLVTYFIPGASCINAEISAKNSY